MMQKVTFSSDVPEFVTTGEQTSEGYEVRVTALIPHPLFVFSGVMRFVIHESETDDGYCGENVWIIPVSDLTCICSFAVQEHYEDGARLLVLCIYNEGDMFERPDIAIEIDRAILHA